MPFIKNKSMKGTYEAVYLDKRGRATVLNKGIHFILKKAVAYCEKHMIEKVGSFYFYDTLGEVGFLYDFCCSEVRKNFFTDLHQYGLSKAYIDYATCVKDYYYLFYLVNNLKGI